MKNFNQPGNALTFTAPRDVVSGAPVQIGQLVVVPAISAANGARFTGLVEGVFSVPKATSQSWTEGAYVYWDEANDVFTTTAEGNLGAGVAVKAAGSSDTTGTVRLDGVGRVQEET